jgi:hypothetical protein
MVTRLPRAKKQIRSFKGDAILKKEQHGKPLYEALIYHFSGLRRNFLDMENTLLDLGKQNATTENEVERVKQATQVNDLLADLYMGRDVFDQAVDELIKAAMGLSYHAKDPSFPRPDTQDLRYVWNSKKARYEPGSHAEHFASSANRQERFIGAEGYEPTENSNIRTGNFGDKSKPQI